MMKKKYIYLTILSCGLLLLGACAKNVKTPQTDDKSSVKVKKKSQKTKTDKLMQRVKKMSLNEKIGQLYFVHSSGNFEQEKQDVKKYQLGGITLFGPDFQKRTHQQFLDQISQYQTVSKTGLLVATDQEGGTVSRLNSNKEISDRAYPSPREVYQHGGLTAVEKEYSDVAAILRKNGINMNFAPVADVAKNKSSFIYDRTVSQDYNETAKYVAASVKAIQNKRVAATLKHFPGYGDASDTHTGFAQINKSFTAYKNEDLLPFQAGIKAGADGIMVSHIVINSFDPKMPASLSPKIHNYLRKQMHYRGLIITDDLQMGAITQFAQRHHTNADVLALKAGNDVILGGNPQTGIPLIEQAVKKKQISEKQIDQSVYRILKLKEKLGILK